MNKHQVEYSVLAETLALRGIHTVKMYTEQADGSDMRAIGLGMWGAGLRPPHDNLDWTTLM